MLRMCRSCVIGALHAHLLADGAIFGHSLWQIGYDRLAYAAMKWKWTAPGM
jgi:hypothetical protein